MAGTQGGMLRTSTHTTLVRCFRQKKSARHLKLAVESLLDAANVSPKYPCRNFWEAWLLSSLGEGESAGDDFLHVPAGTKVRLYSSRGTLNYAFLSDERKFRMLTKALPVIVGVFEGTRRGKETQWRRVMTCDTSQ